MPTPSEPSGLLPDIPLDSIEPTFLLETDGNGNIFTGPVATDAPDAASRDRKRQPRQRLSQSSTERLKSILAAPSHISVNRTPSTSGNKTRRRSRNAKSLDSLNVVVGNDFSTPTHANANANVSVNVNDRLSSTPPSSSSSSNPVSEPTPISKPSQSRTRLALIKNRNGVGTSGNISSRSPPRSTSVSSVGLRTSKVSSHPTLSTMTRISSSPSFINTSKRAQTFRRNMLPQRAASTVLPPPNTALVNKRFNSLGNRSSHQPRSTRFTVSHGLQQFSSYYQLKQHQHQHQQYPHQSPSSMHRPLSFGSISGHNVQSKMSSQSLSLPRGSHAPAVTSAQNAASVNSTFTELSAADERARVSRTNTNGAASENRSADTAHGSATNSNRRATMPLVSVPSGRTVSSGSNNVAGTLRPTNSAESFVSTASSALSSSASTPNNAVMNSMLVQMAQRSNASTVKSTLQQLRDICRQHQRDDGEDDDHDSLLNPDVPLQECYMLSVWSTDAYYKVIISKYNGIPIILDTMKSFPHHEEIQGVCCSILKHFPATSDTCAAVLQSMEHHPKSVHVQSEACCTLQVFTQRQGDELSWCDADRLRPLLRHADEMYLTPNGKASVGYLLEWCSRTTESDGDVPIASMRDGSRSMNI